MKQAIIHIGMHKTGTSSIQRTFKEYDDGEMRYVQLGSVNHSHLICAIFKEDIGKRSSSNDKRSMMVVGGRIGDIKNKLDQEVSLDRREIIISGEGIVRLSEEEIQKMVDYFSKKGLEPQFLAYVREPIGFSSSSFQQQLKADRTRFQVVLPQYRHRFERFIDIAGRESVEFIEFSRDKLLNGSVVSDFASRIGAEAKNLNEHTANESLSATTVALLFFWNKEALVTPESMVEAKARRATIRFISKHFPGKFRFDQGLLLRNLDEDDVRWMEDVSGFSLMPSGVPEAGEGIRSEADFEVLRQNARDTLAQISKRRGVDLPAAASTSVILTRLYQSFLRQTRQR